MKVLFVDESNVAVGNMSILLESLGAEVVGNATTEKEIETTIKRHKPELILIDTRSSYIDGPNTISRIKQKNPDINVVVVSVFDNQRSVKQVFATGINDILTKPIESNRLVESLRKLGLLENNNEDSQDK